MSSKSKLETQIKELARLPENKFCFDCKRPGPQQNVNLSTNTFVCTTCAGIHRQFSHKIKTINMSTFTEAEVEGLQNGGNTKAAKYWLGKWSESAYRVDPDDPKNVEQFMRLVYQQRRWIKEETEEKEKEKEKKEKKKKVKAAVDAVKIAGPNGVLSVKSVAVDKSGQDGAAFATAFPPVQQQNQTQAQPQAQSPGGFDFLTNMSSLSFEDSKPAAAHSSATFASGFEDSPFNQSRRSSVDAFDSPAFPPVNGHSAPHSQSQSPAVTALIGHLRSVQSQFGLDSAALQQAVHSALQAIKEETHKSAPVFPASSSQPLFPAAAPSAASHAPVSQAAPAVAAAPKPSQDFFADLAVPGAADDDDDGNPFGSDSEEDEPQNSRPAMQFPTGAAPAAAPAPQPQAAAFFAPTNGFPGAAFPPAANPAAAFYPSVPMQVPVSVQVPMQVPVHPAAAAQFAAQNAFLQHQHQQAQLAHAQQAAREHIQMQQQQQKRAVTDQVLFSGLNPTELL